MDVFYKKIEESKNWAKLNDLNGAYVTFCEPLK